MGGTRKRRWFQFGTRTMLIAVFAISAVLGVVGHFVDQLRRERIAAFELEKLGLEVNKYLDGWRAYLFPALFVEADIPVSQVSDNDLVHLDNLTRLRYLSLWGANVSDSGLQH